MSATAASINASGRESIVRAQTRSLKVPEPYPQGRGHGDASIKTHGHLADTG